MRRVLPSLLIVVLLFLGAGPASAAAGSASGSTSTTAAPAEGGDIIPKPDSGVAPQSSGDRGGAGQLAVFIGVLVGIATIVFLAYRSSKKARASRT